MRVLRSRLYELELEKQQSAIAAERKTMVGSGDRSEKIRTYKLPAEPPHRSPDRPHASISSTLVMEGRLDQIVDAPGFALPERESSAATRQPSAMTPTSLCSTSPQHADQPEPLRLGHGGASDSSCSSASDTCRRDRFSARKERFPSALRRREALGKPQSSTTPEANKRVSVEASGVWLEERLSLAASVLRVLPPARSGTFRTSKAYWLFQALKHDRPFLVFMRLMTPLLDGGRMSGEFWCSPAFVIPP